MGSVIVRYINPEAPVNAPDIHIGVDIGQKHDPTAIVVAELHIRASERMRHVEATHDSTGYHPAYDTPIEETVYHVHHMERLALGTSYPEVAQRVAAIVCAYRLRDRKRHVLMDATGVGQPVYELVREAIMASPNHRGVWVRPITFAYGATYDQKSGRLGKAYLVSRLQRLIQTQCIKLPKEHPEALVMVEEVRNYEIHVDQDGHDTYGAFKVGTHDDLATALGLAVLEDPADYAIKIGPRLF
jgi:Terminase RNaseH-like domain